MSDQQSTIQSIRNMFNAGSVALVGASADPSKYGFMTLDCIIRGGYEGRIYPVNPKGGKILGLKAYPSLMDLPEVPDVAVILVPVKAVPHVIRDAGEKGIPGVVITTAGYSEVGRDDLQQELTQLAKEYGVRVIGPNIEGFIYMPNKLNAQFFPVIENPGPLATISQSGSLTNGLSEWADKEGLGICATINLGNQVDICESDFMECLADDDHVLAMALYLEGVKNGPRFLKALSRVTRKKPVVILKAGRSGAGERCAASHTASLAGAHPVFRAACRQNGAIVVDTLQALYDTGKLLSTMRIPGGRRLLILSSSGGLGVLSVDEAEGRGVKVPALPPAFKKELDTLGLSPLGSYANPIDLADIRAEEFRKVALLADRHDVADVILINFGDPILEGGDMIMDLKGQLKAGLVVSYMGGAEEEAVDRPRMNRAGIPVFSSPEQAVRAISAAMEYGHFQRTAARERPGETLARDGETGQAYGSRVQTEQPPEVLIAADQPGMIPEPEAARLLGQYGIVYPEHCFSPDLDALTRAAETLGFPVVLKVVSKEVIHKSDSGGVRVNIHSPEELSAAFQEIGTRVRAAQPDAVIDGMLMCRQAPEGVELIIGALKDPVFGPTLMVGMGGIFTEVMADTAFRIAPLSPADAREMLMELKGYPLLTGARGSRPCDIDAVADLLVRVSQLVVDHPEISELDLNPVRVFETGTQALDVRMMIE